VADSVQITERTNLSTAAILARRGISTATIGHSLGVKLPHGPYWSTADLYVVIGNGPGSWVAYGEGLPSDWCGDLAKQLTGIASVIDQTGAYRSFRIEGPHARTLLQRGLHIDLNASAFPSDSVAISVIGHVDVIVRALSDESSFEVTVFCSYADSFLRWFASVAAGL
jgi:heterotetrameric sarcosine oxidase gamma subunit